MSIDVLHYITAVWLGQTDNRLNGLFSSTTWLVRPFWILMKQVTLARPLQIICTLLQIDNHPSTSLFNF